MAQMVKGQADCPPKCRYQMADGSCDYLCQAGHRRGCPPGPDCIRYEPSEGYQPKTVRPPQPRREVEGYVKRPTAKQSLENDRRALELYQKGATDPEIARATGWAKSTVGKWRRDNGLPGNRKGVSLTQREAAVIRLYDQGHSDPEIAGAIGCSTYAVFHWRRRTGRQANRRPGWQKGKARKETTQ